MNFKQYHVSKNLLSEKYENRSINGSGAFTIDSNYDLWLGEVVAGQTYTISNMDYVYGFFATKPMPNTGATYDGSRGYEMFGTAVVTVPSGCTWVAVRVLHNANNAMLNTGSQPLPYEPYSSEVWHDVPYYIHNISTDTITTLPAVIYPNDTAATVGLKGNMSQSSTPSPSSPIQPQECGERTENLWDIPDIDDLNINTQELIDLGSDITYSTLSIVVNFIDAVSANADGGFIYLENSGGTKKWTIAKSFKNSITETAITTNENINGDYYYTFSNVSFRKIVLVSRGYCRLTGSAKIAFYDVSKKNYEPYGYKIPILSADTTTPIYLGEVETTRKIKKYEFTGQETGWNYSTSGGRTRAYIALSDSLGASLCICSHYDYVASSIFYPDIDKFTLNATGSILIGLDSTIYTDVTVFKSYLAQQYANGTPVTVWYVLATPQTAVVNEPLMRIGDYADTLSNVSIPVTAGGDTLSVGTTVQPSEVTVNYKGWHPVADVHEKSKNLLPPPSQEQSGTLNGITYYVHADGSVDLSGIAEANVTINIDLANEFTIPVSTSQGGGGTIALNNSFTNSSSITLLYNSTVIDSWGFSTPNRTSTSYSAMANKTINRYSIGIVSGTNLSSGGKVGLAFSNNGTPVTPYQPYWK